MQPDMHYYGTYAIARAAGLNVQNAKTVAYASQYVDDATHNDSEQHEDGGMLQATATSHDNGAAISNAHFDLNEQRRVWVPFHFFPGNEGQTVSERLQYVKDGILAQEMVQNHIKHAVLTKKEYGLALMGVMAHVYADTFSHYGFSGVSSRNNAVKSDGFEFKVEDPTVLAYINDKYVKFLDKYAPSFIIQNWRKVVSEGAEDAVAHLGHGGVGTYPDRPFLKWRFSYENGKDSGWRNNSETYLEGCEKIHAAFTEFAKQADLTDQNAVPFETIKSEVEKILRLEADKDKRIDAWKQAIQANKLFESADDEALDYDENDWEEQKKGFTSLPASGDVTEQGIYQFHQAATYHRDYTLKELLPKNGLVVL